MKVAKVISLISEKGVTKPEDALWAGLPLRYIGSGAYRQVFEVVGTNLIIKFAGDTPQALGHSVKEYQSVTDILKSTLPEVVAIKKHLPKLYWCDVTKGITVGRKYKKLPPSNRSARLKLDAKLNKVLKGAFDVDNSGNVGVDGRGTLKLIDSGFISL